MGFVPGDDAGEDLQCFRNRGFVDHHRRESAFERRIGGDVLAKFVVRGGSDTGELATGHCALELVGGVLGSVSRCSGTDQGVQLVDEHHHAALCFADLLLEMIQLFRK